ncbi:MAG: GAF domain-containing protein [Chloroflexi bacterium]|nr:GAF domain-containing protein [Chloroflexota bacterium]
MVENTPDDGRSPHIEPAEHAELATLAVIGRAILQAQLNLDQLCDLIYELAGRIVPTEIFQLGLLDGDQYQIKVWVRDGERQPPTTFTLAEGEGIIGWMRVSKQPLLVHDFEAEMATLPARPRYISNHPPRSAVFIPMLVGDGVIGAIAIQSYQPYAFDEGHLRLLSVLANQSASALNNARLYQRGQRRLNDLTAISEVGRKLTSILELDPLLAQVVELIQSRFGYYHVQLFLLGRGSDRAHFKASSGHDLNEKWRREGRSMRIGQEGIIGWVAQHGEPLLANDVAAEPRYISDDPRLLPDTRAELAVPLIVEDEVVGVLDVQSTEVGAFDQNDLFILRTLADQVAVAVNSARAYEAQREEAWGTTVMLQVAEAASQAESMADVLDSVARVTAMLAGVESCTLWLWDDDLLAFQYGASYGLNFGEEDDPTTALRFFTGDWPALDDLRAAKTAVVITPGGPDMPAMLHPWCPGDTVALLPMLNKGQVFGVMGVSFLQERAPSLTERRLVMLGGIAHQAAAAVENSRLAATLQAEAWISTVLLQVAEAVRRLQPLDETLTQVARLAPALTGVDRCAILLRDDEGAFRVRTVHALREGQAEPYRDAVIRPGDLPLLDDACRLGQPLVVDDACSSALVPDAWRERYGSCTLLVLPLLVADEVIGVLLADDVVTTHLFSPRRVRILSGIAGQTAVAIENARLQAQEAEQARLGRELELAHDIQRGLMPAEAPHLPGYQIVYRWRSAHEVGGDFFDFMALPSGKLGLVIADVSDKGIPAALYMMFARTLLRAVAMSGREPASALARANELAVSDSAADMFVTAYYSILDPRRHILTYASAGHNLALYAPADDQPPVPMTTAGIALGVVVPANFTQKTLALASGDVVLFYTDGVTEAINAAEEQFGE